MSRFRKYRRRRYPVRKRRYKRQGTGLNKKVSYLMRQNKVNRPELDKVDNNESDVNIWTTPAVVTLGHFGGGSNRGTFKSIQLKGQLKLSSPTAGRDHYRIVVFTDKSNEGGAIPGWGEVYIGEEGVDAIRSLRFISTNQNEGQRFKVLYDKTFNLINDADGQVKNVLFFNFYKKLSIKSIDAGEYWEKGGLYLAYVGTSATGVADFSYNIRTRFVENP